MPSGGGPGRNPAPDRYRVDAADGRGDPGQPAVHGPAGVEPAAVRAGPGRSGEHRAPGLRLVQASAGISLVQRQARLSPRYGYTSATAPGPARPRNTYVREDQILPHLAALAILFTGDGTADGPGVVNLTVPGDAADLIDRLRATGTVLTYDPDTWPLTAPEPRHRKEEDRNLQAPAAAGRARVTMLHARERGLMGNYCVRGRSRTNCTSVRPQLAAPAERDVRRS